MAMPPPPARSLRVAVIGAGAAGLATARELRREGHAAVVFERAHAVGGTWLYHDHADEQSSSSSLYASLRTNLPREVMGFLDFPLAAAPDSVDPRRFPRHQEVLRYIQAFARRFHLHGLVRLRTEVLAVTKDDGDLEESSSCRWRVRWRRNAAAGDEADEEEVFDAVVVCNGHYTEPRTAADIPGLDAWPPAKQMHSHSYRVPAPFADQVVVIVGASNSGADISREIAGVAREVHMADRSAPDATCRRLPGYRNLWLRSMVARADQDGTTVVFRDGSSVRADVVMHCTGYKYSFPFLRLMTTTAGVEVGEGDDTPGVVSVDDNRIHPLYKHVFVPQRWLPTSPSSACPSR